MNKDSNFSVFYLLIVFFVIMIFIPPVLRIITPADEQVNNNSQSDKEKPRVDSKQLNCEFNQTLDEKKLKLNITTNYYNKKITYIIFNYDISLLQGIELPPELGIFYEINELKNISGIEYNNFETEEIISIYSTDIISTEPKLEKHRQNIDAQKLYYEQLGLVCNIINS